MRGSVKTALQERELVPGGAPRPEQGVTAVRPLAVALRLARALAGQTGDALFLAVDERRAEEIARALRPLLRSHAIMLFQPWDCLPYDRVSPSREVMGGRLAVLQALATTGESPRLVVTSPEAILQKVAPPQESFAIAKNTMLDRTALKAFAMRTGYLVEHRVDDPGEIALQGQTVDVFPAGADRPVRLMLGDDDRVEHVRVYDPSSQRTEAEIEALTLDPASEVTLPEDAPREPGIEHRLPEFRHDLVSLLELLPDALLASEEDALAGCRRFRTRVEEAHAARRLLAARGEPAPTVPAHLYGATKELEAAFSRRHLSCSMSGCEPVPNFAVAADSSRALVAFLSEQAASGHSVVLVGLPHEQERFRRMLKKLKSPLREIGDLADVDATRGDVWLLSGDFDGGVIDHEAGLAVVTVTDVFGARLADNNCARALPGLRQVPQPGDIVVHEDHGVAILRGLQTVAVEGGEGDMLALEYHGGDVLLAPVEEFDRLWRYSSEADSVSLDRLHTDGWNKRRVKVSGYVEDAAARLIAMARERAEAKTPPVVPPKGEMAKFVAGFVYPETVDQRAAIADVLADLASGTPMNRLICGDVGFGKTEVALRAAAAVALSGRQVALVAPTTVLARQHAETFRKRFAGSGVGVEHLSRFASADEVKHAKRRLAGGEAGIVVGTQAVVSEGVVFTDLALVIVDEEHRLGAKLKEAIRAMAPHHLALSATPIPRTLQGALVGVQDVSLLAAPPARRRAVRTALSPFDPAVVQSALIKEKRRGGQSFVVVPRIEDVAEVRDLLARQVPDLTVAVAHGDLPANEIDEAMVRFAGGDVDVLLATTLIESGLDVPRANTMLVWNAELFGLAQLHQLRGRVGRGRAQGIVTLFAPADEDLARTTAERLAALLAADRLGAGFTLSARDLDLRGGGDLVGDEQAGHMRLIGASLYQHLLQDAVRAAKGERVEDRRPPEMKLTGSASIPVAYVPDEVIRLELYARFAAAADEEAIDDLRDELQDRFGDLPAETVRLLSARHLALLAERAGVTAVAVGPKATALSFAPKHAERAKGLPEATAGRWKNGRLIIDEGGHVASETLARVLVDLAGPEPD